MIFAIVLSVINFILILFLFKVLQNNCKTYQKNIQNQNLWNKTLLNKVDNLENRMEHLKDDGK